MLTGTSMARYGGIAGMVSVLVLRCERAERGGLLVGDSHDYALSPKPFIEEEMADLLLGRMGRYPGIARPVVRQLTGLLLVVAVDQFSAWLRRRL